MKRAFLSTLAIALLIALPGRAEVLGPCGTPDALKPAASVNNAPAAPAAQAPAAAAVGRLPLPGDQAPNFSLPALIGDEVREIKLSDYDGKWRVVCFYPADFTFV